MLLACGDCAEEGAIFAVIRAGGKGVFIRPDTLQALFAGFSPHRRRIVGPIAKQGGDGGTANHANSGNTPCQQQKAGRGTVATFCSNFHGNGGGSAMCSLARAHLAK